VYLANNDPHVAGASRYGQHLPRVVTLQCLFFVAVTVYVPLISTSTERFYVPLARINSDHFPQLDCQFPQLHCQFSQLDCQFSQLDCQFE